MVGNSLAKAFQYAYECKRMKATVSTGTERSSPLGAEAWEKAALKAIADRGFSGAAIEPLAKKLGVTKGSFYWHFADREALIRAALKRWEKRSTEDVIASLEAIEDPRDRLRQLFRQVSQPGPWTRLSLTISAAANDPVVRPVLQRVSKRRIDFVARCYRQLGFSGQDARHRARLAYAAYLGFLHLSREAPKVVSNRADFAAYVEHVIGTLVPRRIRVI
jgi:AcrR family transcriptional regulator